MTSGESLTTKEKLGTLTRYGFEATTSSALVFLTGVNKLLKPEVFVDTTLLSGMVGGLIVGGVCAAVSTWILDPEAIDQDPTPTPPARAYQTDESLAEIITLRRIENLPDHLAA